MNHAEVLLFSCPKPELRGPPPHARTGPRQRDGDGANGAGRAHETGEAARWDVARGRVFGGAMAMAIMGRRVR